MHLAQGRRLPRQVFEYDPPDRFVAGTVGQPGHRTFYLQAAGDGRTTSVALEKQQVAALAQRVEELLDEVVRRSGGTASVPAVAPADSQDLEPLATPVDEEFRVGTMSLAWDPDSERVLHLRCAMGTAAIPLKTWFGSRASL